MEIRVLFPNLELENLSIGQLTLDPPKGVELQIEHSPSDSSLLSRVEKVPEGLITLRARMENWNQDLPERYSKFCGLYIIFQGHGKWPWTW